MNNKLKLIKLFLVFGIILISSFFCAAETEDKTDDAIRPKNSDPESRAISPQLEYTEDKPAEWEAIANDHLPEIVFEKSKSKDNVKVKVLGKKFNERHYIEVIGLMDERKADIDIKYVERGSNPIAILSLDLKDHDPEKIKVFAKCNLHDLWTKPLLPTSEN